jgi:hypothetical protein
MGQALEELLAVVEKLSFFPWVWYKKMAAVS